MKLIIVESPTKAEKIKNILGNGYDTVSSYGHICDLAKGGHHGIGVDIINDFKPKYILLKDKVDVLQSILNKAENSDEIMILRDGDFEGAAIAYHVKRYLLGINKPIRIGILNEITEKGVKDALNSLSDLDIKLFHAQEARRILDRIVGFMVSPYLINYYGPHLSAGRVQSVAVRMIVDREKEIENFKPEEFWNIFAKFKNAANEQFIAKFHGRPSNKDNANLTVDLIKKENEFYVSAVKRQNKKEKPCPPMTTAALQQYMARKHSIDPDRTMKAAQSLYENGFCTYIRTDSTRISNEALQPVRDWIAENGFDVPKKPNVYKTKDTAQDAHECIRPTNIKNHPDKSILSSDEKEVYRAIWQHFIACQMNPAVWNTLHVDICARVNEKLTFTVSGKALDYKGYLEIFGPVDTGKIDIPNLTKGDILVLSGNNSIKAEQKFTQPLPRFNDASIIKELENREIGRPSTYSNIIKTITDRNYVEKSGPTYRSTELGVKITDELTHFFTFLNYNYTSNLESLLDKIASGDNSKLNTLKEFYSIFSSELKKAYNSRIDKNSKICDSCSCLLIKLNGQLGEYYRCSNQECKKTKSANKN